jgi:hypothetical protein
MIEAEQVTKVPLAEDDDAIEAISADRTDEPFGVSILPNFKRPDVRSGGATRRLEEKRRSCLQRKVAHGIEDDHLVQTLAADGSETSRSRQ